MAKNRMANIFKGMAARKELKASHLKVYLVIFAGIQEGVSYDETSIAEITGMHLRTVQKTLAELIQTGNINKANGLLMCTFDTGIPYGPQAAIGAKSYLNGKEQAESQSMYSESKILYYVSKDQISDFRNKRSDTHDICLRISDLPKEDRMGADNRFKEVVDGLFDVYEKETKKKLNPIFGGDDAAMIKRLLKNLPEETVDRLVESFRIFLTSPDRFHGTQIGTKPVRYWATRINEFLPEKDVDFKKAYVKMLKKED